VSRGGGETLDPAQILAAILPDAALLAVSGGPDSTALMGLAARLPGCYVVATVDHGLRAASAEEAGAVARLAAALGLEHRLLGWRGPHPGAGLQEAAREARYRLLADLARDLGLPAIVTAHTRDDQAETVLMRVARGTGITGLAAMRPVGPRPDGLVHVRPFLDVPKAALVAVCRAEGWPFVEDPSNEDPRFARTRLRRLMPALAAEGITATRLATLATRAARADEALERVAEAVYAGARRPDGGLPAAALAGAPPEIALRLLTRACRAVAAPGTPERLGRLESALADLLDAARAGRALRRTVAGTILRLDRSGLVTFAGEGERRRGRQQSVDQDAAAAPGSLGKGGGGA